MGIDPISISVAVMQAAQAAAQQAVFVMSENLAGGAALAGGAGGAKAGAAGAGESAFSATSAQPAFTATAQREGLAAATHAAKGVAGAAAANPAVQAATSAGATAGVQSALADTETPKAPKLQGQQGADAAAGLAADRERRRRAPGRGATLLNPNGALGLGSPRGGQRSSPGVAALAGTLG